MKIVPAITLIFFVASPSLAQAPPKADRRVVTPGETTVKVTLSKTAPTVMTIMPTTAFIRVFHAVPGGPKVDVFDGTLKIASNRGFTGITSYTPVESGKHSLRVVATGQNSPNIVADSFNFSRGKHYTVAIYGKKAPQLLSINESNGKETIEKAKVRVVHLVPGAPELMVTAPSTRGDLGYAKFISKPLEYGESSSKTFKPKTTTIQIRTAEGQLIKQAPSFNFEAGKRYNAFIVGEIETTKTNTLEVIVKSAGE